MNTFDVSKKMAIIVPYRNRQEHLAQFIPHTINYFQSDKLDSQINYSIHIIEQSDCNPFNRGKLLNCGFSLVNKKVDYVVFHDVDYLPLWADYSFPSNPTRLIWHGLTLKEDYETFFGAVVTISCDQFVSINGFSNNYWHWGAEDMDLRNRIIASGLTIVKKDGTYQPLKHEHQGFNQGGKLKENVSPNFAYLEKVWKEMPNQFHIEGLTSLDYQLISSRNIIYNNVLHPHIFLHHVKV